MTEQQQPMPNEARDSSKQEDLPRTGTSISSGPPTSRESPSIGEPEATMQVPVREGARTRPAEVDLADKSSADEPSTEPQRPLSPKSEPRDQHPQQVFLDNRVIGWTFLVFVSLLGVCIIFAFVYFVVVSMSSPSFLDEYVKSRSDIPAQLTVTLEYESRTMKTIGVQIAFGFLVGLVFAGIGVLLFAAGANGAMQLKSSAGWLPVSLSATAPGLAVLVLGGVIIAIAVSKDVGRDISAEMNLPGGSSGRQQAKQVTSTPPHDPGADSAEGPP